MILFCLIANVFQKKTSEKPQSHIGSGKRAAKTETPKTTNSNRIQVFTARKLRLHIGSGILGAKTEAPKRQTRIGFKFSRCASSARLPRYTYPAPRIPLHTSRDTHSATHPATHPATPPATPPATQPATHSSHIRSLSHMVASLTHAAGREFAA